MSRSPIVSLTAAAVLLAVFSGGLASAAVGNKIFYLTAHPRQCLIGSAKSGTAGAKSIEVVPCSDPRHTFEVYAVGHGGWGHSNPPAGKTLHAILRTVCLTAYQGLTGHALGSTDGWYALWPDPGDETARYGDKIICSFRTWPALLPLGAGWHVR